MLWELFEIPYKTPYQEWPAYTVKERVMGGYRLQTPKEMPDAVVLIMKRCWDHDPERRPTANEVRRQLEIVNQVILYIQYFIILFLIIFRHIMMMIIYQQEDLKLLKKIKIKNLQQLQHEVVQL